jgi:hypothetical protein
MNRGRPASILSLQLQKGCEKSKEIALTFWARICKSFQEPRNRSAGPVRQPYFSYLSYRPARLHRLAESIPLNRFLGSLNVYKYGLCNICWRDIGNSVQNVSLYRTA